MLNGFTGAFKVIFDWCRNTPITFGNVSFTFAEFFLFQIFAGILIWFICYVLYDR